MPDTNPLFHNLKPSYSLEEAKSEIDVIVKRFSESCKITFHKTNAEITDSYKVTEKNTRLIVCEIIARSGVTKRSCEDLSAEWQVHNVAYAAGIGKDHAKDVNLDYDGDPRLAVQAATKIFETLKLE